MRVILWIWQRIAPLVMIAGGLYWIFVLLNKDWEDVILLDMTTSCILGGICSVIGFILGFTEWAEDVPPRLFWVKSNVDLFDEKFGYALILGIQFFFIPTAVALIVIVVNAA